jgi:hypothetical protein
LTQFRGSNTDNDPDAGADSEADERVPAAVALASRGDPQNVLPLEGLAILPEADYEPIVAHALKLAAVGLGVVQDDPDLLSRR